jgi:hypothetical protein
MPTSRNGMNVAADGSAERRYRGVSRRILRKCRRS